MTPGLPAVCRLRVRFSRGGQACALSQLGQIKALRRLAEESGLPLCAAGRNSARMSFGPAISEGYASGAEYADIFLTRAVSPAQALEQLGRCDGHGLRAEEAAKVPLGFPSVEALVNVAEYEVKGDFSSPPRGLEEFLARSEIVIEKVKPSGERQAIDARPLIRELGFGPDGALRLVLRFGPKRNLKPERILQAWLERPVCLGDGGFSIIRKRLYWEDASGNLNAP